MHDLRTPPLMLALVVACAGNRGPTSRSSAAASTQNPMHYTGVLNSEVQVAIARMLEDAVERNRGYGGGVLRIASLNHGLLWEGAVGDVRHKGPQLSAGDSFEIASVTKTFTAVCVMLLQEGGRIDLDAPVSG